MFFRNLKPIFAVLFLVGGVVIIFLNTKTVCNNEYSENAKRNKEIENLEVCVKENNVEAAILLSKLYAEGDNVQKDYQKAIDIIKNFADSGNGLAMIELAHLYSSYEKKYIDFEEAEKWYKKAINNQDSYSENTKLGLAYFYSWKYMRTKNIQDLNLYIDWLNKLSDEGNTKAMLLLAEEYKEGYKLPKNYNESLKWVKKAADKNDIKAYRTIGNYYVNGFLGEPDYQEANYWFQKAADNGDDISQKFLEDNPKPLGLEITKATISDFKQKFTRYKKSNLPNYFNGGYTYFVNPEDIPYKGVADDVVFVFSKNNILEAVLIVFNKNQCIEVQQHIKSKYTPLIEGSNMFEQALTTIKLIGRYQFFSLSNTTRYNSEVCTLTYQSRAFEYLIYQKEQLLRQKKEEETKQKKNLL